MNRLTVIAVTILLGACAVNMGAPDPIDVPTVALRTADGTGSAAVADALRGARARAAFVASDQDEAWFREVAEAAELTLSGPADLDGLNLAFLAPEPLGDTTLTLPYEGGSVAIHDALYEIEDGRLLDLLAFRIQDEAAARDAVAALLEYVATDVGNSAALVMAAIVPTAAAGDSVARMLSPAYYDVLRCETGAAPASRRGGIRLFYGPEARMYCEAGATEDAVVGDWIRAQLVMGRR